MAKKPPVTSNINNKTRTIGFEIEYAGIVLESSAQTIKELYGGNIKKINDAVINVKNTKLGDFKVEIDAKPLQKIAKNTQKLKEDKTKNKEFLNKISLEMGQTINETGAKIAPFEVVSPPIPINAIDTLDKLRAKLCAKGAKDTKDTFFSAFGLHINPEAASLDTDYIIHHIQSFLLLASWLKKTHKIDITRRITSFIDPFPKEYCKLVLNENYTPQIEQLIKDYHTYNPTRNRALDMLPLFKHINSTLVTALYGEEEKINSRPTFHYRLPNSELSNPKWNLNTEWQRWLYVEKLAANKQLLKALIKAWQKHSKSWFSTEARWTKHIGKILQKNYG